MNWQTGTALVAFALASLATRGALGVSSAEELVFQARAHEAAHEEDLAVRRYTEAIELDPSNGDAWTGLGEIRMRLGDPVEAERVFSAGLERNPSLYRALAGRARARWALGDHDGAEADLQTYADHGIDADAYRELASWFGTDGRTPAELATWRRLLAAANHDGNAAGWSEAHRMVRALVVLVDRADPAAAPEDPDSTRRALAHIARRAP